MENQEYSSLAGKADAAFKQAAYKVIQRAKQTGTPIIIWAEGGIKEVPPEELEMSMAKIFPPQARA
jgi:hypothetical protein